MAQLGFGKTYYVTTHNLFLWKGANIMVYRQKYDYESIPTGSWSPNSTDLYFWYSFVEFAVGGPDFCIRGQQTLNRTNLKLPLGSYNVRTNITKFIIWPQFLLQSVCLEFAIHRKENYLWFAHKLCHRQKTYRQSVGQMERTLKAIFLSALAALQLPLVRRCQWVSATLEIW